METDREAPAGREAALAVGWFLVHLTLQLVRLEGEAGHWLSLVLLPLAVLTWLRLDRGPRRAARDALASVGLERGRLTRGLAWAVPLGLGLSALTLVISRRADAFLDLLTSGRALLAIPLALVFLLVTAAFTEELFFRGVLQNRISRWTSSTAAGVAIAATLFALYHLPYAWLHPAWPTSGDLPAALRVSLVEGLPGGLLLGIVYAAAGRNLVAAIVVHAAIDWLPVTTMIRFGGA